MIKWVALATILYSNTTMACSSCGSGGDDPLILYPSDTTRVYFGATRSRFERNIRFNGDPKPISGVRERSRYVFATGQRLTDRSFLVLAVPQVTNVGKEETRTGLGDPSLAMRYTFLRQSFAKPIIPQLQLLGGFKPATSRSVFDAEDQREYLDAFGSGNNQTRIGLDLWSGMTQIQYGVGVNYVVTDAATLNDEQVKLGNSFAANLTGGYTYGKWRAVTGVVRTQREATQIEGETIANSESLRHTFFITTSLRLARIHELRFTFVDGGKTGPNYNTTADTTYTGAYVVSL